MPPQVIEAMAALKQAAAQVNKDFGLPNDVADAIIQDSHGLLCFCSLLLEYRVRRVNDAASLWFRR